MDSETNAKLSCEEDLINSFDNRKVVPQEDKYSVQKKILDIPPKPRVNPSDIDESHIIFGKRTRKRTEKAKNLEPGALIATINAFITGKAKELRRKLLEMP